MFGVVRERGGGEQDSPHIRHVATAASSFSSRSSISSSSSGNLVIFIHLRTLSSFAPPRGTPDPAEHLGHDAVVETSHDRGRRQLI